MTSKWPQFEEKMKKEGLNDAAIAAFKHNYEVLESNASTLIGEADIAPVDSLPRLDDMNVTPDASLLQKTVVLKLNGGLGTGMGLDRAKSLLEVKNGETFLDLIAKQVVQMREDTGSQVAFMLMNSFSTSEDTLKYLAKYETLSGDTGLEFLQNKSPKVDASDLSPATWPKDPSQEWCPPGHGDLYPAILGSGTLDKLLARGMRFLFVSNSDNLGATMDLKLLTHFAKSGAPFMMEVAERTESDKKGGHLAKDVKTGGLLLRESAQCPDDAADAFQDVTKCAGSPFTAPAQDLWALTNRGMVHPRRYKYFNTNNLWLDLVALHEAMQKHGGLLPLPLIKNGKTVDPRDKGSAKVIQLETAMGSAISLFPGAGAVCVPRTRFAPVKTTNDLFALRSDAYVITADHRVQLAPERNGVPPVVKLDGAYKFVDALAKLGTVPSLINCTKVVIEVGAALGCAGGEALICSPALARAGQCGVCAGRRGQGRGDFRQWRRRQEGGTSR